jgi:hypothetical protein
MPYLKDGRKNTEEDGAHNTALKVERKNIFFMSFFKSF